ncbi:MAG: UDP-N-acetylglucosamine 2-epimerase [Ignavibacteriaceae bacterium]|nr:UDP-N-acetylglucosamine 2-epimerase [Ignavibacteriaceae bacterium]
MKICIFTASRAEYGLLKPLIERLLADKEVSVFLIVSGMHLSHEFGQTKNEIITNRLAGYEEVEILLSSDSSIGVAKAMGLGMISYAEVLKRVNPDLLIVLGDRFEVLSVTAAAVVCKIPVGHIHGGELTAGAYDNSIRHAITKMSHLHFACHENYRKRIIQMGEIPESVFNVGALGVDNLSKLQLMGEEELESSIGFNLDKPFFIVTFHPETLETQSASEQINELLTSLNKFTGYKIIFTKANADEQGRAINERISDFVSENTKDYALFDSLGNLRYLSALKHSELLIGNSSSGILEMPYFDKPTINIGERQKGRVFPSSVISCGAKENEITEAINLGLSLEFRNSIKGQKKEFGDGNTAERIYQIIKEKLGSGISLKKDFFDITFSEG